MVRSEILAESSLTLISAASILVTLNEFEFLKDFKIKLIKETSDQLPWHLIQLSLFLIELLLLQPAWVCLRFKIVSNASLHSKSLFDI